MELTNTFRVDATRERAFAVLTDIPLIAPCMPGAELQEVTDEEFRGVVRVKVGPITAQYKGAARFLERDEPNGRVVIRAEGRDTRGQGNASATITATLDGDGEATRVTVHTDLNITGRVAQFGRGVLADVSAKLMEQFAECLQAQVLSTSGNTSNFDDLTATTGVNSSKNERVEAVDLLQVAGRPVAKRIVPAVVVIAIVLWLLRRVLS